MTTKLRLGACVLALVSTLSTWNGTALAGPRGGPPARQPAPALSEPRAGAGTSVPAVATDPAPQSPAAAPDARSVLVVPVYATARDALVPTQLAADIRGRVSDWYARVSGGAVSMTAAALPWQRVPAKALPCDDFAAMQRVGGQAAKAAGRDPAGFDHVVVYASGKDCAPAPATGQQPGRYVVLLGQQADLIHELGHNLGLGHANLLRCADRTGRPVVLSDDCTIQHYQDRYDAMGSLEQAFNAPHRAALGWLGGRTTRVSSSGTYRLAPYLSAPGTGSVALRVNTGLRAYWLESRTRRGVDRALPTGVTDGVLVHRDAVDVLQPPGDTLLLDMTPDTLGENDEDLDPGRTWTDPERSVRISVGRLNDQGLPVTVTYLSTWAPPVQDPKVTNAPDVLMSWHAFPGRRPDGLVVRRTIDRCPDTRHDGTAVGGTAWRTSQRDTADPATVICYGVFARYGDSWSPVVLLDPGS